MLFVIIRLILIGGKLRSHRKRESTDLNIKYKAII